MSSTGGAPATKPLVSVIVTSYNYLHYITQAIDSALAQTYPNVEVVVVDNASSDGTVPALRARYGDDPRVRIFANATNIGETGNVNRGFELSTGDIVLWLSADDWLLPRHLERAVEVFEREPAIDIVHSGAYIADPEGLVWTLRQMPGQLPFDYVDARDEIIDMFLTTCPLCYMGALFRRSLLLEIGPEDPDGPASDWEMQIRMAASGKRFAYLADPSVVARLHPGQYNAQNYYASGRNVWDFIELLDRYGEHPAFERLRGREQGIVAHIDRLVLQTRAEAGDHPFLPAEQARIDGWREKLEARAAHYEPARVRQRLISVIVPTPQSPQLAARALASIERQTHPNWEIVVLDHGPMPLGEWLRSLPVWDRLRYARTPLSLSPGQARNDAMRLARGEYLAFLDEDNTFAPTHLETLVGAIESTGASIAATSTRCFLETADDHLTAFTTDAEIRVHRTPDDPAELSLIAAALPLNAVMFYRHMLDRAGTFDPALWILEDYEYLLRLEARAPIAFSSALTLELRVGLRLNTALGAFLPRYLQTLEAIHAASAVSPQIAEARAQHHAAVGSAIAAVAGTSPGRERIAQLIATLCGRAVIPARAPA